VSDNPLIVEDGVSGFLFDPHSPDAIAASISRLAELDFESRRAIGMAGRRRAESLFTPESCARRYEELLACAADARRKKA
jgi:glycosyltransferase involved in cell wall biosynthesis